MLQIPRCRHSFHFVEYSPWPLLCSIGCFTLPVGFVMFFHCFKLGLLLLALGLTLVISVLTIWWRDVIREAMFQGNHTFTVTYLIKIGFGLFIISEVMFFFAIFWAFFHSSLSPPVEWGCFLPANCIELISTWGVPLFNTILLLSSGATVTLCHHCFMCSRYQHSISSLQATILLALIFTVWQGYEYHSTWLNISDGNAGSTFFLATGFHGLHVLIGTFFLSVSLVRQLLYHFSSMHLLGFEAASWYFHFVDDAWILGQLA